jgi:hypothetical protein
MQWPFLLLSSGMPLEETRPGLWTINTESGLPVFTFLTGEALQVDTVVFPAPEHRLGLHALWHWQKRRVQTFWFCEAEGWRRKDATATFVRHLWQRTLHRCLALLPRFVMPRSQGVQEFLVKGLLALQGRSEIPEVWHRAGESRDRAYWTVQIGADNDILPAYPQVRPFNRIRFLHFASSRASSMRISRIHELSSQEANLGHEVELLISDPSYETSAACRMDFKNLRCHWLNRSELSARDSQEIDLDLLRAAPSAVREQAFYLTAALLRRWPDVLHCWDHPSTLVGALAGFAAGVPRIFLHSADSECLEAHDQEVPNSPFWYEVLLRSKRVLFVSDDSDLIVDREVVKESVRHPGQLDCNQLAPCA